MTDSGADSYYRQICEHLGVALFAVDTDLNIQTWNAAAARTFGAHARQMLGTPVGAVFPQEARARAEQFLRRAAATGEIMPFEFQHRDSDGGHRELIATFAPVVSDAGVRIGASACIRDVTQRIELQREVDESRKMVALGELAGTIAHHFNNIHGGVITAADFALESENSATMRRVLKQATQALYRASRLVNGLLAFSQGEQRTDDLSDFSEILYALVDDIEAEAEGVGIRLELNLPRLPILPVPRTQVTTILRSILRNAIEAMPNGGSLIIDVSLKAETILTAIRDTGCGLDESARMRVFEPFWSTKRGPVDKPGDTVGLGLAIAHGLVRVLGGTVSVSSEPSKGSCFRVTLPRPATTP